MIASILAALARLISGAAVEWRCDPASTRQRIYFANHSSHLDFVVIWSALSPAARQQVRPVAGRDYWDRGPLRRYLSSRVFKAILIDRARPGPGKALDAIEQMADGMGHRHSLIVFPEGTRSVTGEVGPFKSGLYYLASRRPDVELIPVHVENLNRILPKREALPVPMLSRVVFGQPIAVSQDEPKRPFLERARDAVVELGART